MFKLMGLLLIVPSVMLLTASFFVLLGVSITQEKWLKTFGWVVAIILWISSLVIFSSGTMVSSGGHGKWMGMGNCMMGNCPMMKDGMKGNASGMMNKTDYKAKTAGHCPVK